MNRKLNILFVTFLLVLALTAYDSGGNKVERFADAALQESASIAIPGYESL